jgi:hypothetical protein
MTDEQRLRKALGAVNDLEPPRDDLFAQRALGRGRARAHRRRSAVLGAAAGVALVGAIGGSWLTGAWSGGSSTTASAPERAAVSQTGGGHAADRGAPPQAPGLASALDMRGWFTGPTTPQRAGMEALAPGLAARFPDVFAGAYAADAGNTRLVVGVTRADVELERAVAAGLPAGTVVDYRLVPHSIARLEQVAQQVTAERAGWQAQGVQVRDVRIDPRLDRVVVSATGPDAQGVIAASLGTDLVTVVTDTSGATGG